MTVPVERLVNLALLLASAREPVTADRVRNEVYGYPQGQDDAAFLRMFERDKDDLRRMGFAVIAEGDGGYRLDAEATYAEPLALTPSELAAVRLAGAALIEDESFPFRQELRLALIKLAGVTQLDGASAVLADESPVRQGEAVALLSRCSAVRKRVSFDYTNSLGRHTRRDVEPFGVFLHDGRWYLVGRDVDVDDVRTFAVARMESVSANESRPKTPDFERPRDFDVAAFARLPFQYGPPEAEFEAVLRFGASVAWRAHALTSGHGVVSPHDDGGLSWRVSARSIDALCRWVVENGPGVRLVEPAEARERLRADLKRAVAVHE